MATYNSRQLRRQRTRRSAWECWRPVVITFLVIISTACVWWLLHLAGMT